jgi:hypothetical protein
MDVCMCMDDRCKLRQQCLRFTAAANKRWQSYFVTSPRNGNQCQYFLQNEGERNERYPDKSPGI